jgi:hypothetical protein
MGGPLIRYLCLQMDGTQVFAVKSESDGRAGDNANSACTHVRVQIAWIFTQTDLIRVDR